MRSRWESPDPQTDEVGQLRPADVLQHGIGVGGDDDVGAGL